MKQEEADKKWCPFVRLNIEFAPTGSFNRDGGDCCCIGSDCMAWVWDCRDTDHGHCGLVGK